MKRILSLWLIVSNLLLMGGCVPYHQLGDRLIIQAAGVDFEDGMFVVTAKYFGGENPEGKKSAPEDSIFITEGRGSSISHAFQEAGANSGKPIILTDCQIFIIGSSLRDRPLTEVLTSLVNEYEGYPNIKLAATDGTAAELMNILYKDESFTKNKYAQILAESNLLGFTPASDLYTVIRNLSNKLSCAYLPVLSVIEADSGYTEDGNYVAVTAGALYKGDMYIGNIEDRISAGIAFLHNNEMSTSLTIVYKERPTLININNTTIKMNPVLVGDKIRVRINYNVNASYSESRISFETDEIEELIKQAIFERVAECLTTVVGEMGVDVIGLEETVRSKCFKGWKKVAASWENEIRNCEFVIDGDVNINKYGIRW